MLIRSTTGDFSCKENKNHKWEHAELEIVAKILKRHNKNKRGEKIKEIKKNEN